MPRVNVKLLSVNRAWKGRRFKTREYIAFEKECLYRLPKVQIPEGPYEIRYRFGFTSKLSDLLNPEKLITDILCKKYGFDDRHVFRMILEKEMVKEGQDFFEFDIVRYIK